MGLKVRYLLLAITFSVLVSGCYVKPVRHLASDVSLLKIGESTQEDVLVYLGDPDEHEGMADGTQRWIYKEKKAEFFEKTPLVGGYIGTPEDRMVIVTLKDGIVIDRIYTSSDEDDTKWADDFSWQEKKK